MDITPTVSNFIKHKRISFAKRIEEQRQQAQAEEQPTQERIQQALNRVSDIRQQLGKRA
jgi:archaellum component FlaC